MRFHYFSYLVLTIVFLAVAGQGMGQTTCSTSECHPDFQGGQNTHPTDIGCESCHSVQLEEHVRDASAASLKGGNVCAECHDDVLGYQQMHAPVSEGECYLCHNPHGKMANMLVAEEAYSTRYYIDYTENSYQLCFSCHKRELLMFPDTSFSTGFRDGIKNLHYVHVNKAKRGRSCKLCHGIHGANQPKMIADIVDFGTWRMPLNFQKGETGGQCFPGCHRPQRYDRKTPQQPPAAEK